MDTSKEGGDRGGRKRVSVDDSGIDNESDVSCSSVGFLGLSSVPVILDDNPTLPHPDLVRSVLQREKSTERSCLDLPVEDPDIPQGPHGYKSVESSLGSINAIKARHEGRHEGLREFESPGDAKDLRASLAGSVYLGEISSHWESRSLQNSLLMWDGLQPMEALPTLFPYFEASGVGMPGQGASTVNSMGSKAGWSLGSSLTTRSCENMVWTRNVSAGKGKSSDTRGSLLVCSLTTRSCENIIWNRNV
ncbi:expressed unknown protein [Seminavis robusta]|uniref:Uncharacterized protein n=1 Tax=Seminavis robusta TaxID=568900 RepID=A0A9N8HWC9_9STRA|nr:expressed unknown protein [Seminavis robusta]|eukprot:Sro1954_g307600.1 n/a (248) ;mRNA; r:3697-4440